MAANCRFHTAIHILVLLAMYREERLTSEMIAKSVGTNPVIIRKILGKLRKAGLVSATVGAGGGCELAKSPEKIHHSEVYRAVEGALIEPHANPNKCCPVGNRIHEAMSDVVVSVEKSIDAVLYRTTIAHTVDEIRKLNRKK